MGTWTGPTNSGTLAVVACTYCGSFKKGVSQCPRCERFYCDEHFLWHLARARCQAPTTEAVQ